MPRIYPFNNGLYGGIQLGVSFFIVEQSIADGAGFIDDLTANIRTLGSKISMAQAEISNSLDTIIDIILFGAAAARLNEF